MLVVFFLALFMLVLMLMLMISAVMSAEDIESFLCGPYCGDKERIEAEVRKLRVVAVVDMEMLGGCRFVSVIVERHVFRAVSRNRFVLIAHRVYITVVVQDGRKSCVLVLAALLRAVLVGEVYAAPVDVNLGNIAAPLCFKLLTHLVCGLAVFFGVFLDVFLKLTRFEHGIERLPAACKVGKLTVFYICFCYLGVFMLMLVVMPLHTFFKFLDLCLVSHDLHEVYHLHVLVDRFPERTFHPFVRLAADVYEQVAGGYLDDVGSSRLIAVKVCSVVEKIGYLYIFDVPDYLSHPVILGEDGAYYAYLLAAFLLRRRSAAVVCGRRSFCFRGSSTVIRCCGGIAPARLRAAAPGGADSHSQGHNGRKYSF